MTAPREVTDAEIRAALESLPHDHWSRQWYVDALSSPNHPQRRANARREVAELLADKAVR